MMSVNTSEKNRFVHTWRSPSGKHNRFSSGFTGHLPYHDQRLALARTAIRSGGTLVEVAGRKSSRRDSTMPAGTVPRLSTGTDPTSHPSESAKHQTGVNSSKSERVAEDVLDMSLAPLVGNVIEVTFLIGFIEVDGRGEIVVAEGEHGNGRLDRARRPERMAVHGLRPANRHPVSVLPENSFDGLRLHRIVEGCAAGVRIDVADPLHCQTRFVQSQTHRPRRLG